MFLQVDANGLHENGDILPAIILLRVKTACPENALNLLKGKMQERKKNPSRRQHLEHTVWGSKTWKMFEGLVVPHLCPYGQQIGHMGILQNPMDQTMPNNFA